MKSKILLLTILLFTACNATPKEKIFSDKYRLVWNDDPSSTMTIAWNQYEGKPTLHYGLTPETKERQTPQRTLKYRGMNNQFVRLKNLKANSRYYFKVCTNNQCAQTSYFKTAPNDNTPFTFVAGGDSRSIPRGRIRGNILISKIRPLFIAHGGDYTQDGSPSQWQRWFDEWQETRSSDGRMYPLLVTHGNHENDDHAMLNRLFDIPNENAYNQKTFNFLTLYTLNTELEPAVGYHDMRTHSSKKWDKQTHWFKEKLEADTNTMKIVSYHRPLRPHRASKPEGRLRYSDWSPLFYKHHIKLAIECDSHLVKYTQPLKPDSFGEEGFVVDKKRGTTFIGEGSWGAPTRRNDDDKSWTIDSGKFWQFKLITAMPNKLEIRTVKFGDEYTNYNPNEVKELSQNEQNTHPTQTPNNLTLWNSKIGKVLELKL